jgi:hypothetical protein
MNQINYLSSLDGSIHGAKAAGTTRGNDRHPIIIVQDEAKIYSSALIIALF